MEIGRLGMGIFLVLLGKRNEGAVLSSVEVVTSCSKAERPLGTATLQLSILRSSLVPDSLHRHVPIDFHKVVSFRYVSACPIYMSQLVR